jgi:hypothetical protein
MTALAVISFFRKPDTITIHDVSYIVGIRIIMGFFLIMISHVAVFISQLPSVFLLYRFLMNVYFMTNVVGTLFLVYASANIRVFANGNVTLSFETRVRSVSLILLFVVVLASAAYVYSWVAFKWVHAPKDVFIMKIIKYHEILDIPMLIVMGLNVPGIFNYKIIKAGCFLAAFADLSYESLVYFIPTLDDVLWSFHDYSMMSAMVLWTAGFILIHVHKHRLLKKEKERQEHLV